MDPLKQWLTDLTTKKFVANSLLNDHTCKTLDEEKAKGSSEEEKTKSSLEKKKEEVKPFL